MIYGIPIKLICLVQDTDNVILILCKVNVESDGAHGRIISILEFYNRSNEIQLKDLVLDGFVTGTTAALNDINKHSCKNIN